MLNETEIKHRAFFAKWSVYLAILILVVSIVVLLGWQSDITFLRRPFPTLVSMNPMTAVLFLISAISFLLITATHKSKSKNNAGYLLALIVCLAALTKLLALFGLFDVHIDRILFAQKINTDIVNGLPNSMAPNTAFCFLLTGLSILLLNYKIQDQHIPSQYLALMVFLIGLLSIIGYLYGVQSFYGILSFIPMALHTALCFSVFSVALFLNSPEQGFMKELTGTYTGSTAAKILIPVVLGVPTIIGFIRVYAEHKSIVSFEFGTAIFVLIIILVFLIVTWYVTVLLNRKDKLRIMAEKELKASRKQLERMNEELEGKIRLKTIEIRDTFERVSDVFYAIDADERFTFVNNKAAELMKKDPSELIGRRIWDIFPKQNSSASFLHAYETAIKTQTYQSVESYSSWAGRWFFIHIYPSIAGVSLFLRDVTEKKVAMDAAEKERMLFGSIIQSLPGIFYFYDDKGKFLEWNKNFETVSGYSGEEISNMTPDMFFPDDEKEYIRSRIGIVFTEGISDAEANFLSKNKTKTHYYFTGVKLEYEGKPCLMGVGIDISKQKATEAELRVSEQKYRLLFEWNPMPMWMVSLPDFTFIDVNNAAVNHYGYTKEQFLALHIEDLSPEDQIPRLRKAVKNDFQQVTEMGIWQHKKKSGELIFVEIITHDITYKDKPVRLVLANDVTEKLKAEKELEQSNNMLRQLTSHLQDVREEERKHIAREIHDELGQQLTVIKMDVSWIRKKTDPSNTAILEKIVELSGILDETVNTVRKISSRLRPSLLDDLGLVAAMEWYLNDFKQRTGLDISFNLPKEEIELPESVTTCLFRILQESLTNVARHSGASSVEVKLQENENGIILVIKDDGKGYDGGSSDKKTLGIIGMKERASMVGGKYTITGKPGLGTIVSIEVPSFQYLTTKNE
ncbi:MAG: PAS domain S-box protein [Chitinophagaceae bacterium]